jgi:hypothetical protein
VSCPSTGVITRHEFSRYVCYKLLTLIPVSTALIAISRYSDTIYWLFVYIGLCLAHAGTMFSIKCPHCPYYKADGKLLRCIMFWGIPKIYKASPVPESRVVGYYGPIGILFLTFFPIYWLLFQWELLLLYVLSIVVLVTSISLIECSRCLNSRCDNIIGLKP